MTDKTKVVTKRAKRKLSDIDFTAEGAHVALVSKDQGGPANNHDYALVMKSLNYTPEYIEKIQQVQVTMELPDFLSRFFGIWCEDAEVLARLLGYVEPVDETDDPEDWYENYLLDKLKSFTVLKAANEAADPMLVVSSLSQEDYLQLKQDQALVEKAFATKDRLDKKMKTAKESSAASKKVTKPTEPTEKSQVTIASDAPATNELESVQKSLAATTEALEKAQASLAQFEKEKQEAVTKSKTDRITAIVKDKAKSESLVKAALALKTDEDFNEFATELEAVFKQVEQSLLFREVGVTSGNSTAEKTSGVAALLKAQINKA